jgi:hypothetical protein
MTRKLIVRSALTIVVLGVFAATLSAQQIEFYPNAGGFWPRSTNHGDMRNEGIYGLKAGVFLNQNVQLEGGFGYINHFEMRNAPIGAGFGITPHTVYGLLYDANGVWNFGNRNFFGTRVSPYVTIGAGALTAQVRHADSAFIRGGGFMVDDTGTVVTNTARTIRMDDGDTFLTINYGGGIKAMNVWGPLGFRADIRGRTLPNFYGETMTWPELTGGVVFTWGER